MIRPYTLMECNSRWYNLGLHSDNHNEHSSHTNVGNVAYVVPLRLGQPVDSKVIWQQFCI